MTRSPNCPPDERARIARLYTEDGLTMLEIARRVGRSKSGIGRILRREGVEQRRGRSGGLGRERPANRIQPDVEDEIVRLYTQEIKSALAISLRLPVSKNSVLTVLRRRDVRLRPRSWGAVVRAMPASEVQKVIDAVEGGRTYRQAAEHLGISIYAVRYRLQVAGWKSRPQL